MLPVGWGCSERWHLFVMLFQPRVLVRNGSWSRGQQDESWMKFKGLGMLGWEKLDGRQYRSPGVLHCLKSSLVSWGSDACCVTVYGTVRASNSRESWVTAKVAQLITIWIHLLKKFQYLRAWLLYPTESTRWRFMRSQWMIKSDQRKFGGTEYL